MKPIIFLMAAALFSSCSTVSPRDAMQADVDQAAAIIERFEAIPEVIRFMWVVGRIGSWDDLEDDERKGLLLPDEVTFEHLGRLYEFVRYARSRIEETSHYLDSLEEWLDMLTPEHLAFIRSKNGAKGGDC